MTEKWFYPENENDLSQCYSVREAVFINEQSTPRDIEIDGNDHLATHLLLLEDNKPIATCRMLPLGNNIYKIGRICVLKEYRGKQIGKKLVNSMIEKSKQYGAKQLIIGAQIHAVEFYKKLGFSTTGEEYMEANIPHIDMIKNI